MRISNDKNLSFRAGKIIALFKENSQNPVLKDHALTGSKIGYRAFSVTGDVRIIYERFNGDVRFYDIGTHNQVY